MHENTDLASRYRTAQNDFITLKDKLMNNFEDRVKLESAIKDCRQVSGIFKLKQNEPRHEKTCFSHMQSTKVQISRHIRAV